MMRSNLPSTKVPGTIVISTFISAAPCGGTHRGQHVIEDGLFLHVFRHLEPVELCSTVELRPRADIASHVQLHLWAFPVRGYASLRASEENERPNNDAGRVSGRSVGTCHEALQRPTGRRGVLLPKRPSLLLRRSPSVLLRRKASVLLRRRQRSARRPGSRRLLRRNPTGLPSPRCRRRSLHCAPKFRKRATSRPRLPKFCKSSTPRPAILRPCSMGCWKRPHDSARRRSASY